MNNRTSTDEIWADMLRRDPLQTHVVLDAVRQQCVALGCQRDISPLAPPLLPEVPLCKAHEYRMNSALFDEQIKRGERIKARKRATRENSVVYYVQLARHIKIGTATDLTNRMTALSVHPDSILAVEPGDVKTEHQRHAMFPDERYRRSELFEPSERLLEHIEHVRSLFGDPKSFLRK